MTLNWTDFAVLFVIILAGCTATYLILQRLIRSVSSERQAEMESRLIALANALHALEDRLEELSDFAIPGSLAPVTDTDQTGLEPEPPIPPAREEIAPGILAAITAASAAILGPHARIRAVRALTPNQGVSPWSQQGRVFVQASHNLRSRR